MAYNDLREFIAKAEEIGEVKLVEGAHWENDIGLIVELEAEQPEPKLLLFDKIVGYPKGYRVVATPFATQKRAAIALGLPEQLKDADLVRAYRDKLKGGVKPVLPVEVKTGPVKENILTGDDVDLFKFPVPKWHELDGGRYIGTADCVIIRDPDEGWVNFGTYRCEIHEKNLATLRIAPSRDGYILARKYWDKGLPCPVAVSCGQEPLLFAASTWRRVPWGVSEYDFAGGLGNKPVQVTKGVYTGLPIPATAEIVLEGDLSSPEVETHLEGPFGEWPGYYNGPFQELVFHVKAICHRNNPIIQGAAPSRFPGVWTIGGSLQKAASLWNDLDAQVPGVRGVRMVDDASAHPMVVISLKQEYEGHAKRAGLIGVASSATTFCIRWVIVVDEDIDPFDMSQVLWAMGTRCDPETSIDIIRGTLGLSGVAWQTPEQIRIGTYAQSAAVVLACKPYHWFKKFPPAVQSSPARLEGARKKWAHLFK